MRDFPVLPHFAICRWTVKKTGLRKLGRTARTTLAVTPYSITAGTPSRGFRNPEKMHIPGVPDAFYRSHRLYLYLAGRAGASRSRRPVGPVGLAGTCSGATLSTTTFPQAASPGPAAAQHFPLQRPLRRPRRDLRRRKTFHCNVPSGGPRSGPAAGGPLPGANPRPIRAQVAVASRPVPAHPIGQTGHSQLGWQDAPGIGFHFKVVDGRVILERCQAAGSFGLRGVEQSQAW